MKFTELQSMTEPSLQEKLTELRKELMRLNAQVAVGTVPKNPGQIKQTKKTIARIMQLVTIKQREAPKKAALKTQQAQSARSQKTQGGKQTTHG